MLNIAISAVLGIMIGVFTVFFIEYWKNTGPSAEAAKQNIKV
jgi:capsular polysaccharide biosynthesis protein